MIFIQSLRERRCLAPIKKILKARQLHVWENDYSFRFKCVVRAVWPDGEIKISPNFSKTCPKINQSWFYLKSYVFQKSPKVTVHLGYFWKKNCSQELSKRPIWSHCVRENLNNDWKKSLSCWSNFRTQFIVSSVQQFALLLQGQLVLERQTMHGRSRGYGCHQHISNFITGALQ